MESSLSRFADDVLVTVSADNRVKVWDASAGSRGALSQVLAEPNNLAVTYSSLDVTTTKSKPQGKTKKKKRKNSNSNASDNTATTLVAVGTDKGAITLFDLSTGRVLRRLKHHTARVNDVRFSDDASLLYSCGEDKQIVQWDVASGRVLESWLVGQRAATKVAVDPTNAQRVVTASATLGVWDVAASQQKPVKELLGHSSDVTVLEFSADGRFVVSAARGDRFASVWSADASQPGRQALRVFALDSAPTVLSLTQSSANDALMLLAVSLASTGYVWEALSADDVVAPKKTSKKTKQKKSKGKNNAEDGDMAKTLKPISARDAVCRIVVPRVGSEDMMALAKNDPRYRGKASKKRRGQAAYAAGKIVAARFQEGDDSKILVARGSAVRPVLQVVSIDGHSVVKLEKVRDPTLVDAEKKRKQEKLLNGDASPSLIGQKRKSSSAASSDAVDAKTSLEMAIQATQQMSGVGVVGPEDQTLLNASSVLAASQHAAKRQKTGSKAARAELLAKLQANASATSADKTAATASGASAPSVGSLQVVLSQALRSNDNALIEYCLGQRNAVVIKRTIDRLAAPDVISLLQRLVDKFQTKPSRGQHLIVWIQEILSRHTSLLMSAPQVVQQLVPLHRTVDTRLASFKKLLKLSGRLDLMLSQVNARRAAELSLSDGHPSGPKAVYVEDEDDAEKEGETLFDSDDGAQAMDEEQDDNDDSDDDDDDDDDSREEEEEEDSSEEDSD
eukprot:TRINITY_DN65798_c8_g6_i4.p1 TRINITY_DN65798_c8_g6~~TRINITY_DN65798_c8_g6_i4.p1  ORF type:complete len:734 (-),score=431.93 TRINITY_DN65798_c8_g6_i4:497-2698(-)